MMTFTELSQRLLPQHFLTRLFGSLGRIEWPFLKNFFIRFFIWLYGVNMAEAERTQAHEYQHFNDFFTRHLKEGARPLHPDPSSLVSPCDGTLSVCQKIENHTVFQAKNLSCPLSQLLGTEDAKSLAPFEGGHFATLYLAPKNYHRVHMPFTGTLTKMTYDPGHLFSVSPRTTDTVNRLFGENERVVCWFDTSFGPMVVILVGAMLVGGIATQWEGRVNTAKYRRIQIEKTYGGKGEKAIVLERGEELGYFEMGSTAMILLPKGVFTPLATLTPQQTMILGHALGEIHA